MTSSSRPSARRIPSNPLSRLLPTTSDPLDAFGLPSKGETRLNNPEAQESYYHKIVDRYMKFCADSGDVKELERHFASVSLRTPPSQLGLSNKDSSGGSSNSTSSSKPQRPAPRTATSSGRLQKTQHVYSSSSRSLQAGQLQPLSPSETELHAILHATRKLRESIIATSRTDLFAQRAYIFIIRTSILVRHRESYHPALLYLLRAIHPRTPLAQHELSEFVGHYILDLSCRVGDLHAAYAIRQRYRYHDRKVDRVLHAIVHDDWVAFWRVYHKADGHQRALMEWAAEAMRTHALKCLGRTYFTVERPYVERCCGGLAWAGLIKEYGVGWELDDRGETVTIRRPKVK